MLKQNESCVYRYTFCFCLLCGILRRPYLMYLDSVYFQLMADQISLVHNFKKMLLSNWVSSWISVPQQPCIVTSLIQITLSQNFHIRVGNRSPNHKQTAPEIIHLDTNHFNYLPSWNSLKRTARQRHMMCEAYGEDLLTVGVVFSL